MATALPEDSLILVDAHGLIFQNFHAIPAMTAPDGRPTNALFGFTRDLLTLRNDYKPAYLVCAFDMSGPTFRSQIAADYKAHRKPPPDELVAQFSLIREMIESFPVPVLGIEGYEADDVIATVAEHAAKRGVEVIICSTDKDCRQLIDGKVRMLNLRKRQFLDREGLLADWGIAPEQVVDYQAMVGDSVDNVPGVPGVGAKTASKLLQEFGTLDNILANLDKVGGAKVRENFKASAAAGAVQRSRELVRLDRNVPLTLDWDAWRVREYDAPKLLELFTGYGFRSFAAQVRSSAKAAGAGKNAAVLAAAGMVPGEALQQGDLFAAEAGYEGTEFPFGANEQDTWNGKYQLVDTPAKLTAFLKKLKKQKRFAIDLETTALDPFKAEIVGFAVCWQAGEAYYLAVRGPEGSKLLDPKSTLDELRGPLEDPKVAKINQNIKYDELVLRLNGVRVAGVTGDPMVADYLLHAGERSHDLDGMAAKYLKHTNISITELIGKKGKNQKTIDQVPTDKVAEYAGEDADVAVRLCELLEPQLDEAGLRKLYDELEVPLIEVLAELEHNGIRLDVPYLKELSVEMARQLQEIETEIHRLAGREFNIASLKQLRQVLFDELKLPVQGRTALTGEPSTDQEALEKLAALGHELPKKIIEHRQVSKLKGTYVDALPELVSPKTGRVHASFNQTVAATGRLSASDPNLQNIPARTDQGREIRRAFLPQEGWKLLTADYSQIELRLLAHFSGDEALRKAFAEDRDIHTSVAAEIFHVAEADVTSAQRRVAKTVNFGVIYGMSAHGLGIRLGISRDEAAKFIDAYFARYPKVLDYQDNLLKNCLKTGFVGTILGRRRAFNKKDAVIRSNSTYQQRSGAEREAINMEIQGSAADLIKLAMLAVYRRLNAEKRQARMLLSVHDELVFEAPPAEIKALTSLVREEMSGAMKLSVPLRVDVGVGPNWLDIKG